VSPRPRATVDDSKWPRVYVTWPSESLDDEDFESAVLAMSALVQRHQPYVIIHDARRAVRPTPRQRAFAAEQQKRDAEPTRRLLKGVALVTASPLISGVLTAVNWIFPAPYPQKTFSTLSAAEAWATAQLAKDGG
jgi:hypothetical protein